MIPWLLLACSARMPPAPAIRATTLPIERASAPELTIHPLVVARVVMPDRQARAKGSRSLKHDAPVFVWLVRHPTVGPVLIDAGFGRRTAADPHDYPGRLSTRILGLTMEAPLVDRLPDLLLQPADIRHVLLTHLHADHAGGVEDLPDAALHVDAEEWAWGQKKRRLHGVDPEPFLGRATTPLPWVDQAYGPFPKHADVFGDGSIIALPAPGHTPGSAMFLVNTPEHSWLFTGDAAWINTNWRQPTPKGALPRNLVEVDWRQGAQTLWRLHALIDHPRLTIVAGHEPADLEQLAPWPAPLTPPRR